jgi:hypothetical protein
VNALDRIFRAKNRWDLFWVSMNVADAVVGNQIAKAVRRAVDKKHQDLQDKKPATITVKAERGDAIQQPPDVS